MSDTPTESFEYFIAQKNEIAIVSLVGSLGKDSVTQLEECCSKVMALEAKLIVINLRDVRDMKDTFIRPLAQMLSASRKKGLVRVSGLNPHHKEMLANLGLIRQLELCNNLNEALQSLIQSKKSVA